MDFVAIPKTASAGVDRLETEVSFSSSGIDSTDRHGALREPSAGIVPVLMRYCVSFSTAVFPQLRPWHLNWLVSVLTVGDLLSHGPYVLHFLSHGDAALVIEAH